MSSRRLEKVMVTTIGWWKFHREFEDTFTNEDGSLKVPDCWVFLLTLNRTVYEDTEIHGKVLLKGQSLVSMGEVGKLLGITRKAVRSSFERLEKDGRLKKSWTLDGVGVAFTVTNWAKYQMPAKTSDEQLGATSGATFGATLTGLEAGPQEKMGPPQGPPLGPPSKTDESEHANESDEKPANEADENKRATFRATFTGLQAGAEAKKGPPLGPPHFIKDQLDASIFSPKKYIKNIYITPNTILSDSITPLDENDLIEEPPPAPEPKAKKPRTKAPKPEKKGYAETVLLTEAEYGKLVERMGKELTEHYIEAVNIWKLGRPDVEGKSDYARILRWEFNDRKSGRNPLLENTLKHQRQPFKTQAQRNKEILAEMLEKERMKSMRMEETDASGGLMEAVLGSGYKSNTQVKWPVIDGQVEVESR